MIGVGLVESNNVYVATASNYYTLDSCMYKEANMACWAAKNSSHTVIAYLGDPKEANAIRHFKPIVDEKEVEDNKLSTHYIIRKVLTNSINNLKKAHVIEDCDLVDKIWAPIIIGKDNTLYRLDPFGNVEHILDFVTSGIGYERAYSILYQTRKSKDPIYRILMAITHCMSVPNAGTFPIIIRNTRNPNDVKCFSMMDAMLYIHNYQLKEAK